MIALPLASVDRRELPVPGTDPWYAYSDDPAITVMTDFRERASVVVAAADSVDAALEHMKHAGVRCAFVVGGERTTVVGMITAYDILSEKPLRHIQNVPGRRGDVRVQDIMQPISEWRVVSIRHVEKATVEDVYRMFEDSRLTHVPVMESASDGDPRLRGLLSAARVRKLLSR
jgi:CBS domain-containing protein